MARSRSDELRNILLKLAFQVRAQRGRVAFSSPGGLQSVSAPQTPPRGPSWCVAVASSCVPVASSSVPVALRRVRVASGCVQWRSVAFECATSPRNALKGAIENSRRAARANRFELMAGRLADKAPERLEGVPEEADALSCKWLM